jgi:sporulation protein YlmC with PRC-barrel domain
VKFSELKGKKAVALSEASRIGTVQDVELSPDVRNVVGLVMREDEGGPEFLVPGKAVTAVGHDVVTIDSRNSIMPYGQSEDTTGNPRAHRLLDCQIVTKSGQVLGKIYDFDFDTISGAILAYEYRGGALEGLLGQHHALEPHNIISFGPGIVTVADEARPSKAA